MSQRETVQPTVNERGDEVHPAFGRISAVRSSYGGGGAVLFASDIKHGQTVTITIHGATRRRDLHHDYIHDNGKALVEVEMSEAQWASFVSSMNTSGVPCTIRRTETDWNIPEVPYDPRLAHTMAEVRGTADRLFAEAREAMAAYEKALADKAPAKVRNDALRRLHSALENSKPNVTFAADSLAKHAEDVVQKARADVEAMVLNKAAQLGLTAGQAQHLVELPALSDEAPLALPAVRDDEQS